MDAELSLTGSMLTVAGQLDQLAGAMGALALALQARKDEFRETRRRNRQSDRQ